MNDTFLLFLVNFMYVCFGKMFNPFFYGKTLNLSISIRVAKKNCKEILIPYNDMDQIGAYSGQWPAVSSQRFKTEILTYIKEEINNKNHTHFQNGMCFSFLMCLK